MIIDCISDLHGSFPELEGGDLLIIAGDCTSNDRIPAWNDFFNWLDRQDYRKKVMVAGNHDNFCSSWCVSGAFTHDDYEKMYPGEKPAVSYLCDSGIEFDGLKIWGSPWTQWFSGVNPHCSAFMLKSDQELLKKWDLIPDDTDILITHSPPHGILDHVKRRNKRVGSRWLMSRVFALSPKLHVFGHIHEYGGQVFDSVTTKFVNASIMNEDYEAVNKPVRIIL